MDAKFGYDEFDHNSVLEIRNGLAKRERRKEMLAKQRMDEQQTSGDGTGGDVDMGGIAEGGNDDAIMNSTGGAAAELTVPGANGTRRGWVFNMIPTTLPPSSSNEDEDADPNDKSMGAGFVGAGDEDGDGAGGGNERSGVELFLIDEENRRFKATVVYEPYFYLIPEDRTAAGGAGIVGGGCGSNAAARGNAANDDKDGEEDDLQAVDKQELQSHYQDLLTTLLRLYQPRGLNRVEILRKMDLDAPNHLGAHSQTYGGRPVLKLIFDNVDQLQRIKKEVLDVLRSNERRRKDQGDGFEFATYDANFTSGSEAITSQRVDPLSTLLDIREHDVPYLVRTCIDLDLRAGCWYTLTPLPRNRGGGVILSERDNLQKANPTVLAFDIECTKAPLKFPDADVDSIFMISYMVNGQGYLLLSRHVVGKDVPNFEYTPKPKYPGPFIVINELTEEALIRRFLLEYERIGPQIVVTYNGDFFDWPFLERRAAVYGLDLRREIGVYTTGDSGGGSGGGVDGGEYRGRTCVHLDAFCWVKRDSYLPQGSQGLKAVTKYKLGYDPVEVDPEDMVRYARDRPAHMASYSVSDAVATYYLYDKYVHMFIFSLCTIIPMGPEDVLRKGSGE